jgi:hypothetical protein
VRGYAAIILVGALILIGLFAWMGYPKYVRPQIHRLMSHLLTILILLPLPALSRWWAIALCRAGGGALPVDRARHNSRDVCSVVVTAARDWREWR